MAAVELRYCIRGWVARLPQGTVIFHAMSGEVVVTWGKHAMMHADDASAMVGTLLVGWASNQQGFNTGEELGCGTKYDSQNSSLAPFLDAGNRPLW